MKKLKGFVGKFLALSFTVGIMSISLITPSYAGQVSKQILRDESAQTSDNLVDENALDEDSKGQNTADSSDLEEGTTNSNEQVENTNQEKPDFTDISETDWFYSDVMELAGMGIIAGYPSGEFAATDYITSEQFIKMVVVGFGYKTNDNTLGKWYKKYTDEIEKRAIVVNNEVAYGQSITREQIARIVARTLKQECMTNDKGKDTLIRNAISDFNKISAGYEQDIIDSYYFGIMQGNQDKVINPQDKLTRAEAASIILRMIKEDRRLMLDLKNSNVYECTDSKGDKQSYVLPSYNGVLQREMGEFIDVVIKSTAKTKGVEAYGSNARVDDKSPIIFGTNGYETQAKHDFMTREDNIEEHSKYWDVYLDHSITVNFTEYANFTRYDAPYYFEVTKTLYLKDQEKYADNYAIYDEFFLEYYKEMYEAAFKYLFEDDFDDVWKIFTEGLANRDSQYTVLTGESEMAYSLVEGVYNDRQVRIQATGSYVEATVSLKGVRK